MKYILIYVKETDELDNIIEKDWKLFNSREKIAEYVKEHNIKDFDIAIPEYLYTQKEEKIKEYKEIFEQIGRLAMKEVG